jgi:hypothetical protein
MKKRIAARKKSSNRSKATTNPARKKTAKRTPAKVRNPKSGVRTQTLKKLVYFEVDEYGTITSPNFKEPKINSDIFDLISIDRLTTPKNIIEEVEFPYDAIVNHFRWLAQVEREELMRRIELKDYRDDKELSQMKRIAEALEEGDFGWKKNGSKLKVAKEYLVSRS